MARSSQVSVLVPVKALRLAKRRLAPALAASERQRLATVMLEDVLEACLTAGTFLDIAVVTSDPDVVATAHHMGVAAIDEGPMGGLNAAIRTGLRRMPSPVGGIVILPTDVPYVTAATLRQTVEFCSRENSVVLVRASRDGGTNLLACSPAGLVEPSFGPGSFARHDAGARRIGIEPIQSLPGQPDLDLDQPEDLRSFIAMKTATRTHRLLMDWDLPDRLEAVAIGAGSYA
jgi:2-phospho-L-lactate/phosphoenolpyruvate guanylyltransferase